MSYLLDKKIKRKKLSKIIIGFAVLLLVIFFRTSIFNALSGASHVIFRPVLVVGENFKNSFQGIDSFFRSKKFLSAENEELKKKLAEESATLANYNSLAADNAMFKEILGRKNESSSLLVSAILSKPNHSPYDTLLIDVGEKENVKAGDRVFALGNIPIGRVAEVSPHSSKVALFSTPGEKTEVVVGTLGAFMQLVGRGGGNFEMILPRDFTLENGTEVHLPGITPYVVGTVVTIISDPRDAFIKALLISPVNVQELKFVEVEK